MLLSSFLARFVKIGTLNLIDNKGKIHRFSTTPTPEATVRILSKKLEHRMCYSPMMALGEGYMEGDIVIENGNIYDFLVFCAMNSQQGEFSPFERIAQKINLLCRFFHTKNTLFRSQKNVAHHYDLSETLYRLFLDQDMQYSCAYFKSFKDDLEIAQENKKHHLAAKLHLKSGQKVLDIGSGWGGLAITLARIAQVEVTGLTLSREQHKVATERAKEAGLEDRVRFYLRDYRQETGIYDRIISVGMFEHVGVKHYKEFFRKISSLLKEDGVAVIHSIGSSTGPNRPNPWINRYIFPGGYCPALSETLAALEPSKLYVTDIEILHHHYAETLRQWRIRFLTHQDKIKELWDERFVRMWEFYLACCEVAFREKGYMVFQIQMVRNPAYASLTRDYIGEEEKKYADLFLSNSNAQFVKNTKKKLLI